MATAAPPGMEDFNCLDTTNSTEEATTSTSSRLLTGLENYNYLDVIDSDGSSEDENVRRMPLPVKTMVVVNRPVAQFGSTSDGSGGLDPEFGKNVFTSGILRASPLSSVSNFEHAKLLKAGMGLCDAAELNSLQKEVIPNLYRGDDCIIVGGTVPRGESVSYLIPILGRLITETEQDGVPEPFKSSPLLIILCSNLVSCERIHNLLFTLFYGSGQRHLTYDIISEAKDIKKLRLELSIVISTVSLFSKMARANSRLLGFDKLKYLVYEDVDQLMKCYEEEFKTVQKTLNQIALGSQHFYQRIFCGRKWDHYMESMYMSMQPLRGASDRWAPTLFINSINQLIRYGHVKWYFYHTNAVNEKIEKLLELLRSVDLNNKHKSIFVVCSSAELAIRVNKHLDENGIYTILATTENLRTDTSKHIRQEWNRNLLSERQIMVLNDEALQRLDIRNVTCLINYDQPIRPNVQISSRGAERFSCMWNNFRDIALQKAHPATKHQLKDLEAHFLLTGKEPSLYKLRKFGVDLIQEIPDSLAIIADHMEKRIMEGRPLCQRIKIFGNCVDHICKNRHELLLKELENDPIVPRSGEIEVKIAECINPSLYTAQVLRCFEYQGGKRILKTSWINTFDKISKRLSDHFKNNPDRIPPSTYEPGSLCVIENYFGIFRARIIEVKTRTAENYPKQLRVYCIDCGNYCMIAEEKLHEIPDELETLPQLSVELVLTNLQSLESGTSYSASVNSQAKQITVDRILNGRVLFSINDTVWVNPLVDIERKNADIIQTRSSIRLDLIRKDLAKNNDSHMSQILKLGRDTGFICPELEDIESNPIRDSQFMSQFFQQEDKYYWAFLTTSTKELPTCASVWSTFTRSPYFIFGTQKKFVKELDGVNEELQECIEEHIANRCSQYHVQFVSWYQAGMAVAVRDRITQKWIRGIITNIHDGEERLYDVFFVDIGDDQLKCTNIELFPMPLKLVDKLPFQAIAFRLCHVFPNRSHTWDKDSTDKLMDFTLTEKDDPVLLEVVTFEKLDDPTIPCRYYRATMFMNDGQELGEALVKKEHANFGFFGKELVDNLRKRLVDQMNALFNKLHQNADESDDENGFELMGYDTAEQVLNDVGLEMPTVPSGTQHQPAPLPSTSKAAAATSNSPSKGGFCELRHPTVIWKQGQEYITLHVDVPDVKDYSLSIEHRSKVVSFRTEDPPNYGFELSCFGALFPAPKVTLFGQYVLIKLRKRSNWIWPRITKDGTKYRWLKECLRLDFDDYDRDDNRTIPALVLPEENDSSDSDAEMSDDYVD